MTTIRRLGFTSLSSDPDEGKGPNSGGPVFNVIFIHGLRGHPQHTWESVVAQGNNDGTVKKSRLSFLRPWKGKAKSRSESPEGGTAVTRQSTSEPPQGDAAVTSQSHEQKRIPVYWPSQLLVPDLPQMRVWTYGYNADVIGGLFQANNGNSISEHGRDLANKLEREIDNEHPIIFVVHSLGGIIVKDAIHESKACQQRTKLIIFLGTPHRGSNAAEWGKIAANLAQVGFQDSNKQILRALEVNSEILGRIHRDFVTIAHDKKIKIHSFQESRPLTGIKGFDGKVVSDFSSRFDLPKDLETVETIDADHIRITKYSAREDPGYCAVSGVIKKFCREYASNQSLANAMSSMDIHPKASAPFVVPFSQNPQFIGRKDVISELFVELSPSQYHKRLAIAGLGGVGKTQIAIEFIHKYQKRFPQMAVYWLYASNRQQFENSYSNITERAEVPPRGHANQNKLSLIADWLSRPDTPPWLIVVDNADDGDLFFKAVSENDQQICTFLPQRPGCSILVTTRDGATGHNLTNQEPIEIQPMGDDEAVDLLHARLPQRLRHGMSEALVESLEHLPLAISQATAFMVQNHLDIPGYMALLETDFGPLLSEEHKDIRRYVDNSNAVFVTCMLTFDQIRTKNHPAADTLIRMSFYDRQGIPESLLREESESGVEFSLKTGCLISFSLIQCTQERNHYGMHRLVREATKTWVRKQADSMHWELTAGIALRRILPVMSLENRYDWIKFIPHVNTYLDQHGPEFGHDLAVSAPDLAIERAHLLVYSVDYIKRFGGGSWSFGIHMLKEALEIFDTRFGINHHDSNNVLHRYAEMVSRDKHGPRLSANEVDDILQRLYTAQDQEPEIVIRAGLRIAIMDLLNYRGVNKIEEAQSLARLNIKELQSHVRVDSDCLMGLGNTYIVLAQMYQARADWPSAEANYRAWVSVDVRRYGPDSRTVWNGRCFIVNCLWKSGNIRKAEELNRLIVKAYARKLSNEDPDISLGFRRQNRMLAELGKPQETLEEILSKGDPNQTWERVDNSM